MLTNTDIGDTIIELLLIEQMEREKAMDQPRPLTNFEEHIQQGYLGGDRTPEEWHAMNTELLNIQTQLFDAYKSWRILRDESNKLWKQMADLDKSSAKIEERLQLAIHEFTSKIRPRINLNEKDDATLKRIMDGDIEECDFADPDFSKSFDRIMKQANIPISEESH